MFNLKFTFSSTIFVDVYRVLKQLKLERYKPLFDAEGSKNVLLLQNVEADNVNSIADTFIKAIPYISVELLPLTTKV